MPRLPSAPAAQTAAATSTEFHGPKGALMMGALMWSRSQRRVCMTSTMLDLPCIEQSGVLPNHSSNPCSSAYRAAPARLDTPIFA